MCASLVPVGGLTVSRDEIEPLATEMARVYHASIARIVNAMTTIDECCDDLRKTFAPDKDEGYSRYDFAVGYSYRGRETGRDTIFASMKHAAWEVLIERLGIKNVMSMEARAKFEKDLKDGDMPEITPETIIGMIMGLVDQASTFAQEAVREAFEHLRGRNDKYKTNKKYRVGKKVILTWAIEEGYGKSTFRPSYRSDSFFRSLCGVMLLLDGKTPLRTGENELTEAIRAANDGRGESQYFRLRCFKNGNLHLEFKRLDLLQKLNLIATGSNQIGEDE